MITTRLSTSMSAAASKVWRASANIVKHSKAAKTTTRIPLHLQHQLRQYSNPPKTYFQPRDSFNPGSLTSNSPPSTSPPKTYFQPLDSQNVQSIGHDAQVYNLPISPKPKKKRYFLTPLFALSFLAIGYGVGALLSSLALGPIPEPGSKEDQRLCAEYQKQLNKLPIVQYLSNDPDWTTCDIKKQNYVHKVLGGTRGVGLQETFYNRTTGEVVSIIRFGKCVPGWPSVAHGGVTATMIGEVAAICAGLQTPGVTISPTFQSLIYRSPVPTHKFLVIRARNLPSPGGLENYDFGVICTLTLLDGAVEGRSLITSSVRFVKR